ncbi:MAG: GTP 3',8-cyclase MoaA [marine benthic group bacterium]|nr:GTP 3',8-cyclase MoaA [Gemmatimonadota bacterium]MCL7964352.1 GTP 3',8-cyclase MoaA [Gemmatimonadota bacterium]
MRDGFGRTIDYLRISVIDKCNLRCNYCMPVEGFEWIPRAELLSFEEIAAIVRELVGMGLRRVRITGGEPLIRKDLPVLVALLREIDGVEEISLSTNGILLPRFATDLRLAGVDRVNISLDTLRRDRFEAIARRPERVFDEIMTGVEAAERAGFAPIKINTVLLRGLNDDEVPQFAELTRSRPWHVRFIEMMPVGENLHLADRFIGADEVLERLGSLAELLPDAGPRGNGPARYFRFPGAVGSVGVITPLSHNYCDSCNRMRLTADGRLRTCLFGSHEADLKTPLRAAGTVRAAVERALQQKPQRHMLINGSDSGSGGLGALSQIGG